jgi:hypothetical protein
MLRRIFIASLLLHYVSAFAQLDSLVFEYRNRFPFNPKFDRANNTRSNQIQVINSDQIRESGYTTIGEVMQLADNFMYLHEDDVNLKLSGLNITGFNNQNWILMVNGQRLNQPRINHAFLNELGISVYDIERIEIVNTPGIYLNEYNERGIIHIITKQSKNLLSVNAGYNQGHDRTEKLPNQNRILRNTNIGIGSSLGNWNIQGNYVLHQYLSGWAYRYSDDARILPYHAETEMHSGRVQLAYHNNQTTHLLANTTVAGRRNEQLMSPLSFWIRVSNNNYLSNHTGYTYKKVGTTHEWKLRLNNDFIQNPVATQSFNINAANATFSYTHKSLPEGKRFLFTKELGIAQQLLVVQNTPDYLIRPYASINYPLARRTNLYADGAVSLIDKKLLPKATLGIYKNAYDLYNWNLSATYLQRSDLEDQGYFYLALNNTNTFRKLAYITQSFNVDYLFSLNLGKDFKFTWQTGYWYSKHEPIKGLVYTEVIPIFPTEVVLLSEASSRWINRLNLHYDVIRKLDIDINYLNIHQFNKPNWSFVNKQPQRLSLMATYELPAKFNIWTRFLFQTSYLTHFRMNELSLPGLSTLTLPPGHYGLSFLENSYEMRTLDIALSKQFGKNKHQFNIAWRNLYEFPVSGWYNNQLITAGFQFNLNTNFGTASANP